jgi:retron-type reverse transcriptase
MKRTRIELEDIASLDNLACAVYKAGRGKRLRSDVCDFFRHFDDNIARLQSDINNAQMPYGRFKRFTIHDPKKRVIHAACFEDRVFHHAVMNLAEPTFERSLVPSTFACRPGKGSLAAVKQVQHAIRRYRWYVKVDIEHYFESIGHGLMLDLLKRRFKGQDFLALLARIIQGHHPSAGKGLPIGSLTSQHFANYYLDGLDRFIIERLPARAHVRYMDDVIWWVDDKKTAVQTLEEVTHYVEQNRRLKIKSSTQINRSRRGVSYCGYRILPGALRLSARRRRRYASHRRAWEKAWHMGLISDTKLQSAYDAVYAVTAHADSRSWRKGNLDRYPAYDV